MRITDTPISNKSFRVDKPIEGGYKTEYHTMDTENAIRVQVTWGREWLDLTAVSPELFKEYLIKYGYPSKFEVSGDKDLVYKESND